MNARDIKHIIRRRWCLEEAKNAMLLDCFVLLNYCMVEKENKTFSVFQNNIQNAATDLMELFQVQVVTNNLRQEGEERQPQTLKIFNKLIVQE